MYYEVLVGDQQYHGNEPLTYSFDQKLAAGQIVQVRLRNKRVLAIVRRSVTRPAFATKPIEGTLAAPAIPSELIKLHDWLHAYYPAPLGSVTRLFLPPTSVLTDKPAVVSLPKISSNIPPLTEEQTAALKIINQPGSYLLHGVTGSGKSRVYAELAKTQLAAGRSSLILTPEIGLTAQLVATFRRFFERDIYVLHSRLTGAERREIWYQILRAADRPVIVIGPRSALFSPITNLGFIAVDESHDSAYKNESAPHYLAGRVAAKLASLHQSIYVSGSATPGLDDYTLARAKQRPVITMQAIAARGETDHAVETELVDLKNRDNFGRSRIVSDQLIKRITVALSNREQSLLFLNRRGTANIVLCNNCGWQTLCPNCDLPLTYHADEQGLRCHICGHHERLPSSCPVCRHTDILLKSIGTKAVMSEVKKLFPQARLQRFDTDTKKADSVEAQLEALQSGDVDIIIGTQMVAKGLDLPGLSVVGVISADSSLMIPDYTAGERTYQLLSQVLGRVGRGHRAASVVIQSYEPSNVVLQSAVKRDWDGYVERELAERQAYKFPPYVFLLKLWCLRATESGAEKAATTLARSLSNAAGITVEGPTKAFHPRERGKFKWQLVVKAKQRSHLIEIIGQLPSGWSYDIDPINLL